MEESNGRFSRVLNASRALSLLLMTCLVLVAVRSVASIIPPFFLLVVEASFLPSFLKGILLFLPIAALPNGDCEESAAMYREIGTWDPSRLRPDDLVDEHVCWSVLGICTVREEMVSIVNQ